MIFSTSTKAKVTSFLYSYIYPASVMSFIHNQLSLSLRFNDYFPGEPGSVGAY